MENTASEENARAFSAAMGACTREIAETLSLLQESYGTSPVFAALIEIAGCASCLGGGQPTSESPRTLVARIEHHWHPSPMHGNRRFLG